MKILNIEHLIFNSDDDDDYDDDRENAAIDFVDKNRCFEHWKNIFFLLGGSKTAILTIPKKMT